MNHLFAVKTFFSNWKDRCQRKLIIQLCFQQSHNPVNKRQTSLNETKAHILDLDCSTELPKLQSDDHKPLSTVTCQVETSLLKQVCSILLSSQQRQQSEADEEECRNNWMMVAMMIDRLLLFVFTFLTIVVSSVLLLNHPAYSNSLANPLDIEDWSRMLQLCRVTQYIIICKMIYGISEGQNYVRSFSTLGFVTSDMSLAKWIPYLLRLKLNCLVAKQRARTYINKSTCYRDAPFLCGCNAISWLSSFCIHDTYRWDGMFRSKSHSHYNCESISMLFLLLLIDKDSCKSPWRQNKNPCLLSMRLWGDGLNREGAWSTLTIVKAGSLITISK